LSDLDITGGSDAVQQVLREGLFKRGPRTARYTIRATRAKMHRRLPGRISATNDEDIATSIAQRRLARPCTVVDTSSGKPVLGRQIGTPVFESGGVYSSPRDNFRPIGKGPDSLAGLKFATPPASDQDLCSESACLLAGPLRQFRPADALGKPQIILDLGTVPGFGHRRPNIHADGRHAFRRGIDRCAQAGGRSSREPSGKMQTGGGDRAGPIHRPRRADHRRRPIRPIRRGYRCAGGNRGSCMPATIRISPGSGRDWCDYLVRGMSYPLKGKAITFGVSSR
jgi:hypothetical protein